MNTIYMPYALINQSTPTFKELDIPTGMRIAGVLSNIKRLYSTPMQQQTNISERLKEKSLEIQKQSVLFNTKYLEAKSQLNILLTKNKAIFDKDAQLSDENCGVKLFWIICNTSRQEQLIKHRQKYQHIYEQRNALETKIRFYRPYAPEHLNATINRELEKLKMQLEAQSESTIQSYFSNLERQRQIYKNQLAQIYEQIYLYDGLVSKLRIDIGDGTCAFSCTWTSLYDAQSKKLNQTLINKTAQIIR